MIACACGGIIELALVGFVALLSGLLTRLYNRSKNRGSTKPSSNRKTSG